LDSLASDQNHLLPFSLGELDRSTQPGSLEELHFWRDASGNEVDVVVARDAGLLALEIKSGRTIAGDWLDGLERFARVSGAARGALVYGGEASQRRSGATIFGWRDIGGAARRLLG
jgi:predicted AAA+ superfamily ATPase